ncbi:hypothetical protein RJJ37_01555 [Rhizobium redzepovicii]|uniref:Lipoprotein n=1 Tax=Rhizobium redzepovicii TaxID=2867518 RepID=A0AAW8NYI9_9HYPH|nr:MULTISPECIES: hypothetical protein [Rhizobium]MBY4592348.1 hypothetical protein [Rhizobium redzepovicii]MBY4613154.1 hypothetical protein [Rhizobium redzepovicii]MDF0658028.1 hypothetical protein [Rhizobium sp. BC49]MDR9758323.1 hypothetical protein [Rhizobium redzepovicii]MDR9779359.1 hypothetical protein [Rhizobium redzepovicii]
MVLGKVSRLIVSASILALLAGCDTLGIGGDSKSAAPAQSNGTAQIMPLAPANPTSNNPSIGTAKTAQGAVAPVVQGACPQIFMRDQDAIFRTYAKGKKDDAQQIVFQASFGDYTRQCTLNEANLTMTIVAQLRLITGPAGAPGPVTLPIRVTILDGETVLYSEVTKFPTEIPAGAPGTQVIFRKDGIKMPVGAGALVRVNIGFDTQPAKTKKNS